MKKTKKNRSFLPVKLGRACLTLVITSAVFIPLQGANDLHKNPRTAWSTPQNRQDKEPASKLLGQIPKMYEIKGVVVDEKTNDPIVGANVVVSGTTIGIATDADGNFSLSVPENTLNIEVSFIGYDKKIIPFRPDKLNVFRVIQLRETNKELDEVTVVAFAKQKKESVVGAISTVKPSELKVPSSNLTTALAGRVAGLIAYQRSGEPGEDNANFFVRGVTTFGYAANPLILIDGIEMSADDLAHLQVDDIESFSIMKDATSSALYGARGANGVILVTTKEGSEGKLNASVRFENSISMPTKKIDIADPITYMQLFNEATSTRSLTGQQKYTQEKVDNTIAGINPYVYPTVDWYKMLFKNYTNNQRLNINLSGGGRVARYYVAATYNRDNGILQNDHRNNFNSNIKLNKISIRSNININLTNTTEMVIRMHGTFDDYRGPINGGADMFNRVMRSNPVEFPAYFAPDEANKYARHILFGNAGHGNYINPYADMVRGYKDYSETLLLAQAEFHQKLDFITKGLNARILMNTTRFSYFQSVRSYNPFYYMVDRYDRQKDTYVLEPLNEPYGTEWLTNPSPYESTHTTFYFEGAVQYDRTFKDKHAVGGLLVYTMQNRMEGGQDRLEQSLPFRNIGLAGRFTYGYDSRYFLEGNFGYNGSERFSKKHRFGFFPSIGFGWMISKERFFGNAKNIFNQLKLKGTFGLVGNDAIGGPGDRFFYLANVNMAAGTAPGFGRHFNKPENRSTIAITRYANEDISWETSKKLDLGIETTICDALTLQADYFREDRKNILMNRASVTPEMGLEASVRANVGKAWSQGFDGSIDYNKYFENGFWLQGRLNFTYAVGKYKVYEEPDYSASPWLFHKDKPISQQQGYIAERLFVDEQDIANSPRQIGEYMAGDIKYRDINKDGVIDFRDQVFIGQPTNPKIVYGFGLSMGHKNFDFSFFFQGLAQESFWIDPVSTCPFADTDWDNNIISNNALLNVYAKDHWSETNQNIYALWPRLSDKLIDNNIQQSTWFMRDGTFLRLKSAEIGYSLPENLLHRLHMTKLRFYLSGNNLLTFSKFKLWDPEMAGNGLGYPVQRVFNIGVQLSL